MTSKKQLLFAYGLAIHLLLVAIICYAAFPVTPPDEPIRIMYQTTAGKVLFDHATHAAASGYGASCFDCHHHPLKDRSAVVSCTECHPKTVAENEATPASCLTCHAESEVRGVRMLSRTEALHKGCTDCHAEFEKGPQMDSASCASCHVM
ncbi:cytochrome c family protein [Desulfosarcina sp. OttesenSCG-928-G10]|nr:cytochrome c family protein [Desulfosarcina sp. OttesenSCG-928-G10]MDL2321662.1 cytochrome c family protein [Desulfosarcina sp. OttesenSCG-928-B08]